MKNFICITTWENYKICEREGLWGVEEHRLDDLRNSSKGDVFIFYLKEVRKGAGGYSGAIFERESEQDFEEIKPLWEDGLYPHRVKIKLLDNSTRYKRFHAKYLYEIGVVNDTANLGPWLNTSMQEISENNYKQLVNMIKSNQKLRQ